VKRGIKVDKASKHQLKYKIISKKMDELLKTTAGTSAFEKTQTSWHIDEINHAILKSVTPNTISALDEQNQNLILA